MSRSLKPDALKSNGFSVFSTEPVKLIIGPKRKTFYVFEEQIKNQSNYIKHVLEVKNEDDSNDVKEIYLDDENDSEVASFVSWLYSGKMPADIFGSVDAEICSNMIGLYGMAHRLEATRFQNLLMDKFYDIVIRPGSPDQPQVYHLRNLRAEDLHSSPLYDLMVLLVADALNEFRQIDDDHRANFLADLEFEQNDAPIYHDILIALTKLFVGPLAFPEHLRKKACKLHVHEDADESCYSKECEKYRKQNGM